MLESPCFQWRQWQVGHGTVGTAVAPAANPERNWPQQLGQALIAELMDPGCQTAEAVRSLADAAVRACPDDGGVLSMAVALLLRKGQAGAAERYLNRLEKYYFPLPESRLYRALLWAQKNKLKPARRLLESLDLRRWQQAAWIFPPCLGANDLWLREQFRLIFAPARTASSTVAPRPRKQAPAPAIPAIQLPDRFSLPCLPIELPIEIEVDLGRCFACLTSNRNFSGEEDWHELRSAYLHLSLAQGFDELLCLKHLNQTELLEHQVETARKVLRQFRGRVLLADEVGLGKTIEAGMVLKEYILRGMVERALVLTPPSLVGQWREEMETKFSLRFATTQDSLLRQDPERFWAQPYVIASLALARRQEHSAHLAAGAYDMVIVDEAHHLHARQSLSYKLVDALNKRFLLLLSATPVQNDLIELYNLLSLLKPGILQTLKQFRAEYMVKGKPRQAANPERLRGLMRDAMIRNTRAAAAVRLPRRHVQTLVADSASAEAAAYRHLDELTRELAGRTGHSSRDRMVLRQLLGAAGSSPAAAAAAARRQASANPSDPSWPALAGEWEALRHGAKEDLLLQLLRRNPGEKKLVFVHYRDSLHHLAARLESEGLVYSLFEGGMSGSDKDVAIAAFRNQVPVLLATESGGEGRNIQFCNTLINFDIPWNPMAIEQRIGRLDRIGQARDVFIFNLVNKGTVEEEMLRLLEEKIALFELVVGEAGIILGEIGDGEGFDDLVLEAWLRSSVEERTRAFQELGEKLDQARRQYRGAQQLDEELFGEEFVQS